MGTSHNAKTSGPPTAKCSAPFKSAYLYYYLCPFYQITYVGFFKLALVVRHSVRKLSPSFNPHMLETVAVILVLLWLAGIVSSYTLGGYIHVLLLLALITIVIRVMWGRDPLK
jgi:hypothetical protein